MLSTIFTLAFIITFLSMCILAQHCDEFLIFIIITATAATKRFKKLKRTS